MEENIIDEILLNVWDKESEDVFVMNMESVINEIHIHAYYKWEKAGKPNNKSLEFWLEAEREICDLLGLYLPQPEEEDIHTIKMEEIWAKN
jgi:hypothetical protein